MVNGAGSVGVFAQSVGGGGGAAGFAGGLGLSAVGTLKSTVGGAGGGGNGGNVTVTSTGSIETKGADSVAVIAQSIGGGGGSNAFSIGVQTGALDGAFLQIGASGTGAQGANGNVVVNISGGMTMTNGDLSYGLLSQAIGGGGGNAALSVPDPLTVGVGGVVQALGATGSVAGNGNPLNVQYSNNIPNRGRGRHRLCRANHRRRRRHVGRHRRRRFHGSGARHRVARRLDDGWRLGRRGVAYEHRVDFHRRRLGGGERRRGGGPRGSVDRRRRRHGYLCGWRRDRHGRACAPRARRQRRRNSTTEARSA